MEPMRNHDDPLTGYEDGVIEDSKLLSYPSVESVVFGVALHWEPIGAFVEVANSPDIKTELPMWVTQPRGQITESGFKSDVMALLSEVAGGLSRDDDLAPNTFLQEGHILSRISHIEMEPFVQACMGRLDPETRFANVYRHYECPGFGIQAASLRGPPRPYQQAFY